jgi:hypothetical protein
MSEVLAHSKYSASGFEAMTLCPGKRVLERGKTETPKVYSAWGTVAHGIASELHDGKSVGASGTVVKQDGFDIVIDDEMHACVQTYLDGVREIVGDGWSLAEQRVNYSSYLGVDAADGWGTSDIIALRGAELQVHDLKTGKGVEVDADDNPQMKLYALGALVMLREMGEEPTTVRLVIHQPRIKSAPSEWTCTVAELEAWGRGAARSSVITQINAEKHHAGVSAWGVNGRITDVQWEQTYLRPNDKSCKFCKAKASCPALRTMMVNTVSTSSPATPEDFADAQVVTVGQATPIVWLTTILEKADLIEDLIAAARAEVFRRLDTGETVKGWKLVTGKRGNRAWADPAAAEAQLKAMRLKVEEMYDLKLISPTSAEKLTEGEKPLIGPRQWTKVKALITQADGKPSVAPESDKRPAIVKKATADEFESTPQPQIATTTESEYA